MKTFFRHVIFQKLHTHTHTLFVSLFKEATRGCALLKWESKPRKRNEWYNMQLSLVSHLAQPPDDFLYFSCCLTLSLGSGEGKKHLPHHGNWKVLSSKPPLQPAPVMWAPLMKCTYVIFWQRREGWNVCCFHGYGGDSGDGLQGWDLGTEVAGVQSSTQYSVAIPAILPSDMILYHGVHVV